MLDITHVTLHRTSPSRAATFSSEIEQELP